MSAADEQHLIHEARGGSHAAFRCLVERHMKRVYDVAYSLVQDHDGAEDIVQETFVKVHSSLASFRGESEFGTWLYRIATNFALNHVKQRRRQDERKVHLDHAGHLPAPSGTSGAEESEQRACIEQALHELPTLQRAVVILRHLDGLSTKQVSRILRCSEGTVKTHLFRGLRKMRSKLLVLKESEA
jgi:RNA polymerase sigma-70 factor (ECF subfamily)